MTHRASEWSMKSLTPALIFIGIFVVLLVLLMPEPQVPATALSKITALPPTVVAALPTPLPPTAETVAYSPAAVMEGQGTFQSTCSACHGLDGSGIPGLGKNLLESQFVHGLTDDELLQFISTGRDTSDPLNTTGIAMPPRGGNPSLTDDQMRAMIAYLRTNAVSAAVARDMPMPAPVTPDAPLANPILPTSIPVTPSPFSAQTAYAWSCAGCHGVDGKGNLPFAEGFETSVLLTDRATLLTFLLDGRPLADPRVEFPHSARGGYPALSDEQLSALTDYVIRLISD
ncbi:MAG: c-type cytochrome [Chloroflexota bacterium]